MTFFSCRAFVTIPSNEFGLLSVKVSLNRAPQLSKAPYREESHSRLRVSRIFDRREKSISQYQNLNKQQLF